MRNIFTYDELTNVAAETRNLTHYHDALDSMIGALWPDTDRATTVVALREQLTHLRNSAHRLDMFLADLEALPAEYPAVRA